MLTQVVEGAMELQGMRAGQEQRRVQRQKVTRLTGQGPAGSTGPPGCRGKPGSGG